jgi:peptide/nickel transport system substrate-binding protein
MIGRRGGSTALAALLLASVLAGAMGAGGCVARRPDDGGRFVYPLAIEPATLNFVSGTDQSSVLLERLLSDFLVDHDAHLAVVPRLAQSWDQSQDGLTLVFHLRQGVRFHDGVALTCDDVRFTYERLVDPASKSVGRIDGFLPVERVLCPDPQTVEVRYREPYAPALRAWEIPILPAHLYRHAANAASDAPASNSPANAANGAAAPAADPHDRAPVGAGPFRFASWEAGSRIVLEANPDYWGGRPALDGVVFPIVPSPDTALLALESGETDYARLTPALWSRLENDAAFQRRFRTVRFTPLFFYYIAWRGDGSNPFFADPRVRRAMSLSFDRADYVRSVLRGLGEVIPSPFLHLLPPAGPESDPPGAGAGARDAGADRAAAAALLDQAGWRTDPQGGPRRRNGTPFRFTIEVFSGGEDHIQFAQVAQRSLQALGVEMRIERLDWPTLWQRLKDGRFEAAFSGFLPNPDPDAMYGMLHSSQIGSGQNYAAFRDGDVDAWLQEGRRTLDPVRRVAIYRKIEARLALTEPYSFLFAPSVLAALSRRFDGIEPSPQGILGHVPGAFGFRRAQNLSSAATNSAAAANASGSGP